MSILLIGCRGGNATAPELLRKCGWFYGTRHDYTPAEQPYMLDINWERYSWPDYLDKVKRWKPTLAMIPDYFPQTPKSLMLEQIEQVREAGAIQIMVCPKFDGAVADIPDDVLVAVSVPTEYAGFLPAPEEVIGRRLHLLGGHPDQQAAIIKKRYPRSTVVSGDINNLFFKAMLGACWDAKKGNWIDVRNQFTTEELVVKSGVAIRQYLNHPPKLFPKRERIQKCFPEGQCKHCQKSLAGKRKGALTCSVSCRKAWSRLNHEMYPIFYLS